MSVLRIAHLSDPHFGTILPGVREGLRATLQKIPLDLILITGDITQRARRRQFIEAREFAESFPTTAVIAVPGNHDIPLFNICGRLFDPYRGFRKSFKYRLEKDYRRGDVLITGLNSASRWRHVQGHLNVDRTHNRLREKERGAKVHIVAFHHPMDCKQVTDEKNLLKNRDACMDLFSRHEIDLVVGGHIHDPCIRLSDTRYPNIQRKMILGVAGTCLSWRTRPGAPNSFNLIEVDTKDIPKLSLTRYDQRQDLSYTPQESHQFQRIENVGWSQVSADDSGLDPNLK